MSRQSAIDRTYQELRDLIVRGAMAPGSPVMDQRVAEVVGVSRTTARSVLQQLTRDGFVTSVSIGDHHSRFIVGPLTIDEMKEWYYLFGALDGLAARGAAKLPRERRLEIAERVRDLARAHLEAGSGDDPQYERIEKIDSELHATYVEAGAGPRLLQQHAAIKPHTARYGTFYATALIRRLPTEIFHEHCAIADAIAAGDPDLAERAGVANWRNAAARFEDVMSRAGERGNWQLAPKLSRGAEESIES